MFNYGSNQNTTTFTTLKFPIRPIAIADLPNRTVAEAICRQAGVTEQQTLEACILDVGLTGQVIFATDAATTQALSPNANVATLVVNQPGAVARLTFSATAGQKVFIDVIASTLPDQCGVLILLDTANQSLARGCILSGKGLVDSTVLPTTGQYTLLLDPEDRNIGQAILRLRR